MRKEEYYKNEHTHKFEHFLSLWVFFCINWHLLNIAQSHNSDDPYFSKPFIASYHAYLAFVFPQIF